MWLFWNEVPKKRCHLSIKSLFFLLLSFFLTPLPYSAIFFWVVQNRVQTNEQAYFDQALTNGTVANEAFLRSHCFLFGCHGWQLSVYGNDHFHVRQSPFWGQNAGKYSPPKPSLRRASGDFPIRIRFAKKALKMNDVHCCAFAYAITATKLCRGW